VKKQKAEIDGLRTELEAQIAVLAEQVGEFDGEFARTAAQLAVAEAGACPGGLVPLREDAAVDADADEAMEAAQAALEAADAELAAAQAAVAERRREAAEAERSLGPDEAALAATLAQAEALEDAAGAGVRGADLALQSESAAQYTSELCALLRYAFRFFFVATRIIPPGSCPDASCAATQRLERRRAGVRTPGVAAAAAGGALAAAAPGARQHRAGGGGAGAAHGARGRPGAPRQPPRRRRRARGAGAPRSRRPRLLNSTRQPRRDAV
jgi:prefoldin subunit 5